MNPTPLRLLLAEDSDADAFLMLAALKREGYELETTRVMSSADFRAALAAHDFQVILCDYAMPGFTALDALEILDASGKDIPLIIVSGTIGEDLAVAAMRGGAKDYLMKDRLARLGAVVERELRDAEMRRTKRLADRFSRGQAVTERKLAEDAARVNGLRALKQRNALIELNPGALSGQVGILDAFRCITATTAATLAVARVSIWRFSADRQTFECLDLHDLASGGHSSGLTMAPADYPDYFHALAELEMIAANDALHDPRTCELAAGYLAPLGITAMLDLPIRFGNTTDYFLCNEHVGAAREWTDDEKTFAVAIANLVSLALESADRVAAQQEVLRSHLRFQSVAAATSDTIWDWDLETDAFWWNEGISSRFGASASALKSPTTVQTWISQIYPEDRERVVAGIYAAIREGATDWMDEYRFVNRSGSVCDVIDRGQVIRDAAGEGLRMVGGMSDMTASKAVQRELVRSHRALQMLSLCNEMLVRASDETELLAEACRIAVEVGGYRMAWVGYAMVDEERTIVPMAHHGEEQGYLDELKISWAENHPQGTGPAGIAVRSGNAVVIEDLLECPGFSLWRELARSRGFGGLICIPLRGEIRNFGFLALYTPEPNPVSPDELKMLEEMANNLAFGIGATRSREQIRRTQEVVVKVAQAVSSGIGGEFFDLLALNLVEALGARGGLIGCRVPEGNRIETLSLVIDGKLAANLTYDLAGTPCEAVLEGDLCVFEEKAQQRFPDSCLFADLDIQACAGIPLRRPDGVAVGLLLVFFADRLTDSSLVGSTLRIFAARAAAELDRQQADARIREQASLLDKSRDAIVVCDLDHHITYWNKSAERLYGWTAEEALGQPVHQLLYHNSDDYLKAHARTLHVGEWFGEMQQVDKTRRELAIEGRWTLVRNDKGEPVSVLAINTDISDHRKLEHQFLRAQRLESIGTLAGGIAHDLNNILAPILMAVELLKIRAAEGKSSELLDTIATSAKRGADMVGQVLSFARGIEGNRVDVQPRQLIAEIETILRETLLRSITLNFQTHRDLWSIFGDPTQLHQVLLNLCLNARDSMPTGGKIHIRGENVEIDDSFASMNLEATAGPHVCIEVRDSGTGIAPEIIDRIFDPFFTTKGVGEGTGLGLSTSLTIVRSHGGFIRVLSELGAGTRFRVYLPARPEIGDRDFPPSMPDLPRGKGQTVLVVDDEAAIREITRETLETYGYRVLLAANGQEAIARYTENSAAIGVVLTDMMMPIMDGPATVKRLLEINPAVRIIVTSGISVSPALILLHERGVTDFLAKPYNAQSLLECLQKVLLPAK
ncbi:response regulator [bacterium]|nr:response regulator [bacterium]